MAAAGHWCILRTSGRLTLPLAESLCNAGFDVWTPAEKKRAPRTKAKYVVPIMPTFLFAKAGHLWTLVDLSEDPMSPHPGFSVFRYLNRFPVIDDDELAYLRRFELEARPKDERPMFNPGDAVKATDGSFCGLGGQVIQCRRGWALVAFGGHMTVKISTFLLEQSGIDRFHPATGTAAQAA